MPAAGGEPRRLTWHPVADEARGFTPDGKRVVFASWRLAPHGSDRTAVFERSGLTGWVFVLGKSHPPAVKP